MAKVVTAVHGVAPGLITDLLAVANGLLPEAGGIGEQRAFGRDSETPLSQSFLTSLTDNAAESNNELIR